MVNVYVNYYEFDASEHSHCNWVTRKGREQEKGNKIQG